MAKKLFIFNEAVENDPAGKAAKDDKETVSNRTEPARPREVAQDYVAPGDRELASRITQAIANLQDAMDRASRAGLIIEPSFKPITGRFNEFGVSVESYICSVEIYRKLS